jgi:nucleoside 2-deoxyribosyltransferase
VQIYLASALFDVASRHHNLLLEEALRSASQAHGRNYHIILPQREVLRFFDGKTFDLQKVREDCKDKAATSDVVVANLDGLADDGGGVAFEMGVAVASKRKSRRPWIIGIRTDFRTDLAKEIGVNAMLMLADRIIYHPAFVNDLKQVEIIYKELASGIDACIQELAR